MNLLCLDTIVVEPNLGERPKNAVVFLHGYGGSGKDIVRTKSRLSDCICAE